MKIHSFLFNLLAWYNDSYYIPISMFDNNHFIIKEQN